MLLPNMFSLCQSKSKGIRTKTTNFWEKTQGLVRIEGPLQGQVGVNPIDTANRHLHATFPSHPQHATCKV